MMHEQSVLRQHLRRLVYRLAFWWVRKRIRGHGNSIRRSGAFLKHVTFDIQGNDNQIRIAPGAVLRNVTFHLRGDRHQVVIAEGCGIHRGGLIWFEDRDGRLEIGAGTTIEEAHLAVTEPGRSITIGKDCMLAYDIDIRTGDSHPLLDAASGERLNPADDVSIGDHVWIAAHVRVLKGVRLEHDSVVATGAVVIKPTEQPGVVLGGNPARVIREKVTWSRVRGQ